MGRKKVTYTPLPNRGLIFGIMYSSDIVGFGVRIVRRLRSSSGKWYFNNPQTNELRYRRMGFPFLGILYPYVIFRFGVSTYDVSGLVVSQSIGVGEFAEICVL